ncbi:hypothetical protein FACS1894191_3110 [Clostridia bacterium]|nr:hypothetical protein FACS1894191_3110 [Clostridia bacterium]
MPRKQPWDYERENIRARVYVRGREEIYEIHSGYKGKTLLEYQQAFPLGEPAADFLYGDYSNIFRDLKAGEDLGIGDFAAHRHPFFIFLKQTLYRNPKKFTTLEKEYEALREEFSRLISGVLSDAQNKTKTPRLHRFIAEQSKGAFQIMNGLDYGRIASEFEAAEGFWALADESERPYPLVPPVERLAKGNRPMGLFEILYPESLADLLRFLTAQYLNSDVSFRECKYCGRYFAITGLSKAEYCNRKAYDSEKTCRQIGSMRAYEKKKSENPISKIYTTAYKTHNARIRYGILTREQFNEWSVAARDMRDKCFAGKVTLAELEAWLKD